jgi:HlyD family secretion protein
MRTTRIMLGGLVVGAIAAGALWVGAGGDLSAIANDARNVLTGKQDETPANATRFTPPSISVVKVERRRFLERLRVTGTIAARSEILVTPEIEGQRVAALLVEAGELVEKGQVLAHLSRENLEAQLAQIRAQVRRAEATIAQARGSITQAEARLAEADAALERARPLNQSGYLSASLLDQRQATATSARAALAIARDSLRAAESEKLAAEAQQRELAWRLQRTEIQAPAAGLVLARGARIGAIASARDDVMFRLAADGEIELIAEVPADDLGRVAVDQRADVTAGAVGSVRGKVRLIEPEVDPRTRLGKVRIFIGANRLLHVGQFSVALIDVGRSDGLGVPAAAIMHDGRGAFLHVAGDGRIETRRVRTGLTSDGFVEIIDGLSAGELVVAKAGTFLGDGDRITPVPVEPGPASGTLPQPKAG